ncbi:Myb domain protein 62 [Tanacetum coccineum]
MDKSWMHIVYRLTDPRYELDVKEFLKFAYRFKKNKSLLIPCPCKICNNFRNHKKRTIYSHLMQNGISAGYDEWTHHGESCDVSDDSDDDDVSFNDEEAGSDNMNGDNDDDDADDDLDEMLDNIGQGTWGDKWKTSAESSSSIDKDLESLRRY